MDPALLYRLFLALLTGFFLINIVINYYLYIITLLILRISYCFVEKRFRQTLPVNKKAVLVTGCDSGFGYYLARRLYRDGFTVFAGVLNGDSPGAEELRAYGKGNLHVVKLNVTKEEDITAAVTFIKQKAGDLWGVVNNAGIEVPGDIELCLLDHFRFCQEVNLNGMIAVTKAVLPMIRKSKGRVVQVSSVMGRFPWPRRSTYVITKHGIETMTDSLRMEMQKFGVSVSMVEPGAYAHATKITSPEACERVKKQIEDMWNAASPEVRETYGKEYFNLSHSMYEKYSKEYNEAKAEDAVVALMDAFVDALINTRPKPRYLVGGGTGLFDICLFYVATYHFLPEFLYDFIVNYFTGYRNSIKEQVKSDNSG